MGSLSSKTLSYMLFLMKQNTCTTPHLSEKCAPHIDTKKIFLNCFDLNVGHKCKSKHFFSRKLINFLYEESETFVRLQCAYFLPKFRRPLCQLTPSTSDWIRPIPHQINPSPCSSIFPLNNFLMWLLHLSPVDRD